MAADTANEVPRHGGVHVDDSGCCPVDCSTIRWVMGFCLALILIVNFSLILFVSESPGDAYSAGLLSVVGDAAGGYFTDPSKRTDVFFGQMRSLQHTQWCLQFHSSKPGSKNTVISPTAGRCDTGDKSFEVTAVPDLQPLVNGGYSRRIEALENPLSHCLTATVEGGKSVLEVTSCQSLQSQWFFTKSKQVVLLDGDAVPHQLDHRRINEKAGDGHGDQPPAPGDLQPRNLQCLSLVPSDDDFKLALEPCASLDDDRAALQQWDFKETRNSPDLLHSRAFSKYDFNEFASRKVGKSRQSGWPNTRSGKCPDWDAQRALGHEQFQKVVMERTSVIICFVNEEWFALWRTINSVIDMSPPELLLEIVLVDDGSDAPEMGEPLKKAIRAHPAYHLLKLYRTGSRTGLIKARLFGAERAEASVLTFLDSHIEVNKGWLEPLLSRVSEDATRVVAPVITVIKQDTITNQRSTSVNNVAYGVVDWNLIFHWSYSGSRPAPQVKSERKELTDAVEAPTMAGGLFSIDRDFFYSIGAYDDGMTGWGGENIEISFRIWMCGGSIEVAPCSVVGHIFRQRNPSPFPGSNVNAIFRHNLLRAAEVWMDDFKQIYFKTAGFRQKSMLTEDPDLQTRVALRNDMKCNSFQWYLDTVFPSLFAPRDDFVQYYGSFFQPYTRLNMGDSSANICLRAPSADPKVASGLTTKACSGRQEEKFYVGAAGQIVLGGWPGVTLCVSSTPKASQTPVLNVCSGHHNSTIDPSQKWRAERIDVNGERYVALRNDATNLCLGMSTGGALKGLLGGPTLVKCDKDMSSLVPSGPEDSANHILWEIDKLWGTNGAGAQSAVAKHVPTVVAKRRSTKLAKARSYRTVGQLDCMEDVPGNGIDGWPPGVEGSNVAATLEQCQQACDATQKCNSFSFNTNIGDCWLKVRCGEPKSHCKSFEGYKTYFTDSCLDGG